MKNLFLTLISTIMLSILVSSCTNDQNSLKDLQSKSLTIDNFFDQIINTKIAVEKEHVLYINYTWDSKSQTVKVINTEEKEPDFFVIASYSDNKLNTMSNKEYTVECSNGSNSWTKVCDGKFSCGSLINDCLNQGGCATICNKQMAYAPQTSTFYLIN